MIRRGKVGPTLDTVVEIGWLSFRFCPIQK